MIPTLILAALGPITIFIGLKILNNIYLTFIMFHGIICIVIPVIDLFIIKRYSAKKILHILGFTNLKKTYFKGILIGLIFSIIIYYLFSILSKYIIDNNQINILMKQWKFSKKNILLLLFLMIFTNSVLEEIYWRGYIFYKFKLKLNTKYVILLTSLFYCSYHFITTSNLFTFLYGAIFTFVIFLVGLFWGYAKSKFQSIYLPLISHLLADLSIMVIYLKYIY